MSDSDQSPNAPHATAGGLRLNDVLFILFRYKRLILICTVLGIIASVVLVLTHKPVYETTAKLLVRYVVESSAIDSAGGDRRITNPDARGEATMSSEQEILTSWDLANDVARTLSQGPSERTDTASTNAPRLEVSPIDVQRRLMVVVPRRSTTMLLAYRDTQPERAVRVLTEIVEAYLQKHLSVHRAANAYELLARETDSWRNRLDTTERELRERKEGANVTSLAENKTALNQQVQRIKEALFAAASDRAELEARIREIQKALGTVAPEPGVTNAPVVARPETAVQDRYAQLNERLGYLRRSQSQLLTQFTEESRLVQHLTNQIAQLEIEKTTLEKENPGLTGTVPHDAGLPRPATPDPSSRQLDLVSEYAKLAAAEARFQSLTNQSAIVQKELDDLVSVETEIMKLERQKFIAETNYVYYSSALERARLDEALDPSRMPNISVIQRPSLPLKDPRVLYKKAGVPLAGGLALGLALAFLIEMFIDQRVKKPSEVEHRLGVPLMLTVPEVKGLGSVDLDLTNQDIDVAPAAREKPIPILPSLLTAGGQTEDGGRRTEDGGRRTEGGGQESGVGSPESGARAPSSELRAPSSDLPVRRSAAGIPSLAPWHAQHALRPYFEALRDRLMLFFQLNNMRHKPKLVAVTSCTSGAGTTTMAAGLAAALSETGDGNVLLVDMNLGRGAVHPFFKGRPASSLDDVLEPDKRDTGQVQQNLYLASVHGAGDYQKALPVPKRFHTLMPKMRASDYDYIIFDMPPISETSATVALSASMDQVLLVVEGERSLRGDVKRAYSMLKQYSANVTGVFNKQRALGPKWLLSEG